MLEGLSQEEWGRIDARLEEALDLDPSQRPAWLGQLAAAEPALAAQLQELLSTLEDSTGDAFEEPMAAGMADLRSAALDDVTRDRAGQRLGPYRLLEVLGRGGMGVVYRAERADREFEKTVAIKLIPSGLESPEAERRFRAERQVLAQLEHPGIARLLDGGVTDEGYPYLVMELVEGAPIDRYCDEQGLDKRQRVDRFLAVCDAVQHAHQNLVIHRDLKPANILVSRQGAVKLLDFGVAKLLGEGAGPQPTLVQPHTPGYAAPEQIANQPVSTASDTYSLGVILWSLLDPTAQLRALTAGERPRFDRSVGGDLARILDQALQPEPALRYPTAAALAADLRRYLAGEPISAREPTFAYRVRRFVGRHRWAVASTVAVFGALAAMLGVTLRQAERAQTEADRAQRVAGLMTGLFVDADPYAPTTGEVSVVEILDRGVARVREELADDRELRAELLSVLGRAYLGQEQVEKGVALHEEVLAECRALFGETDPRTGEAMRQLGYSLLVAERGEEAAPLIERSVALAEESAVDHGSDHELARRLFALGLLRHDQGDFAAQEELFSRVVELRRREAGEGSSSLALALGQLSVALESQGRSEASLTHQREAVAMAEATLGADHPYTANLRNNLGVRLRSAGDYEGAVVYFGRALEVLENRPDVPRLELIAPLSNLGRVRLEQGRFAAARPHLERAAEIARSETPEDDFRRLVAIINSATLGTELGAFERAEAGYRQVLAAMVERFGSDHPATTRVRSLLGSCLFAAGQSEAADEALSTALAAQRGSGQNPNGLDETLLSLGALRREQGNLDEARALLEEALELRGEILPAGHWRRAEVEAELALIDRCHDSTASARLAAARKTLEESLPADNHRIQRLGAEAVVGCGP